MRRSVSSIWEHSFAPLEFMLRTLAYVHGSHLSFSHCPLVLKDFAGWAITSPGNTNVESGWVCSVVSEASAA